ncbi:lytic transglycosylase domain-containing protein [Phaeovulum vinaykumarii]|uniref:Soluble lytic murein transglycosylase n=1 Tax=Phaeovulum vinaykumarii TaxID=407234 RepID=A0A1N7LUR2_9RHOB|nr:lytic transglycosylase domain-containing protein [Phaeovulum vinaykumarii]SIS77587.1 soluble lytic murein transglycosylase [Phaeovulum vinaykumarii]SOC07375.1 soluble lytic murein transglycosylase [Phaeovulum vinaykumarii]
MTRSPRSSRHLLSRLRPLALVLAVFPATLARADDPAALAAALQAAGGRDWDAAAAAARASGPLARDIIEWQRLRAGAGRFADYTAFVRRHPDWPGMDLLLRRAEATLDDATAAETLAFFGTRAPLTATGALALAAAHRATNDPEAATRVLVAAWRSLRLSAEDQARMLEAAGPQLAAHHDGRLAMLLDAGRPDEARRMLVLASPDTAAVAAARIALQTETGDVNALIAAVPESRAASAGLARDRARWRARHGLEAGAVEILRERSRSARALGDPALWAGLRAWLAREALREGRPAEAHDLAAHHHLSGGSDFAELEWLAGYAALRLGQTDTALTHFRALEAAVSSPISLSRALYWQGRAHEAAGRTAAARAEYARAAGWQTAYYGQLAAARLDLPLAADLAAPAPLPDWRSAAFVQDPRFQAGVLLQAAGAPDLAERFFLQLAEDLDTDGLARLGRLALDWAHPHLAVRVAKAAALRGTVLGGAYYPLPDFDPASLAPDGVPPELVLAIIRRESEFDPQVVSPSGARGLMQLMPPTAKMMADELALPYDAGRLLRDPAYNARLGAAYLGHLRDDFGDAMALVAAGYNAGPNRTKSWVAEMGDPRDGAVDVIDWVEMIPYSETRNYVMRVLEALPIYRARLTGARRLDPIADLRGHGAARP